MTVEDCTPCEGEGQGDARTLCLCGLLSQASADQWSPPSRH